MSLLTVVGTKCVINFSMELNRAQNKQKGASVKVVKNLLKGESGKVRKELVVIEIYSDLKTNKYTFK